MPLKVRYRRALRGLLYRDDQPRLRGVFLGDRPAIIFSPVDLTGGLVGYSQWGMMGYEPRSAFELMRNIVLYADSRAPAKQ
jgi:hypothetical protein